MTTTKWVPEDGWEKAGDWTDDYDEHPDLDLGLDDSYWESRAEEMMEMTLLGE